ncbi:hypothetical protein PV10_04632 [Exophiala mesophila]|uniref:GH16 domain-containing protein n=1 Tax=Exophiala mesophila TaxID=212818 RepID=A0A0D1ZHU6_EXOME|nr:uncharacterized protein PV10_04632 [Exophiala mesophila]KIV93419.1 hypothetical protein PV10_04632 [Exophiala mesophila]
MRPLISAFLALTPVAFAQYVLEDDYLAGDFASHWNFFTDDDPTNGYVDYVDEATAVSSGLLSTLVNGSVFLGVDSTNPGTGRGRPSVRIESKKNYNNGGLFIIDLAHMPGGQCGSWPAYWLIGPGGADTGEVDMIEAINTDTTNLMSVKTGRECTISQQVMTGTLETTDCNVNTGGVVGCSIDSASPFTFGGGFNSLDGGVYATEWVAEGVTIWYFQRSAIPADITAGTPDPSLWGVPLAKFLTSCNLNDNLINQQLIMNIDFCGDYAGNPFYWDNDPTCKSQADTCNDFSINKWRPPPRQAAPRLLNRRPPV